jgi:hypothetical protein
MSKIKLALAALAVSGVAGLAAFVPQAEAQTVEVMISGSSAMWQALALGAYSQCQATFGAGACYHYTGSSNFNLTDTRPSPVNVDPGGIWIVGDNAGTELWAYLKVDSVVGNRCYFAQPHCNANVLSFPAVGNKISSTLWGDGSVDSLPPAAVQALFTGSGVLVDVAATDIRPEDAAFAECRVNSKLGNGVTGSGDGLDGLGYGTKSAGTCPVKADPQTAKVGSPIKSGSPGSTATANVLAFNISGTDPFSGTAIPGPTTVSVGAAPIVFVIERNHGELASLTNATESQLQQVFSGMDCNASAFGLPSGAIQAYLREPLSGTMNTTEATVFRRPTVPASKGVIGVSQETGVGLTNPLATACASGGGSRFRAIGTGEEVSSVQNSVAQHGTDGIGYTFFSYGNISSIANNSNYGYIQLNGIDPIFQTYGSTLDPGQPATAGVLPAAANLPASCLGAFPCSEHSIWKGGFSFPNLRNGVYRAWSTLRVVSNGTALTNIKALVTKSQVFVVNSVPDYVPATAVGGTTDLGLKLLRSHYQQKDGNGVNLGGTPLNTGADRGGDMGGCILPTTVGTTTFAQTQLIQNATADNNNYGCVLR